MRAPAPSHPIDLAAHRARRAPAQPPEGAPELIMFPSITAAGVARIWEAIRDECEAVEPGSRTG